MIRINTLPTSNTHCVIIIHILSISSHKRQASEMVLLLSSAVLIVVIVQLVDLSTANIEPSLPALYKNQWQRYMLMGMHRIGRSGVEQILSRIADEQRQRRRVEELVMILLKKSVCLNSLKGVGRMMPKRERGCMINAGLSQGCDMSDMIISKQQQAKLSSFLTPGRK